MDKNLLSINEITKNPHLSISFVNNRCEVTHIDNKLIAFGVGDKGLYKLVDTSTSNSCALALEDDSDVLRHKRWSIRLFMYS